MVLLTWFLCFASVPCTLPTIGHLACQWWPISVITLLSALSPLYFCCACESRYFPLFPPIFPSFPLFSPHIPSNFPSHHPDMLLYNNSQIFFHHWYLDSHSQHFPIVPFCLVCLTQEQLHPIYFFPLPYPKKPSFQFTSAYLTKYTFTLPHIAPPPPLYFSIYTPIIHSHTIFPVTAPWWLFLQGVHHIIRVHHPNPTSTIPSIHYNFLNGLTSGPITLYYHQFVTDCFSAQLYNSPDNENLIAIVNREIPNTDTCPTLRLNGQEISDEIKYFCTHPQMKPYNIQQTSLHTSKSNSSILSKKLNIWNGAIPTIYALTI